MPIDDKKKCQTYINLLGLCAQQAQSLAAQLKTIRTTYQTVNPDPTGTMLDGSESAVSTWIDNLDGVANSVVADSCIAAIVPTHDGKALEAS
jgi:hypothetical protein